MTEKPTRMVHPGIGTVEGKDHSKRSEATLAAA
jgi:hypothetical protein